MNLVPTPHSPAQQCAGLAYFLETMKQRGAVLTFEKRSWPDGRRISKTILSGPSRARGMCFRLSLYTQGRAKMTHSVRRRSVYTLSAHDKSPFAVDVPAAPT